MTRKKTATRKKREPLSVEKTTRLYELSPYVRAVAAVATSERRATWLDAQAGMHTDYEPIEKAFRDGAAEARARAHTIRAGVVAKRPQRVLDVIEKTGNEALRATLCAMFQATLVDGLWRTSTADVDFIADGLVTLGGVHHNDHPGMVAAFPRAQALVRDALDLVSTDRVNEVFPPDKRESGWRLHGDGPAKAAAAAVAFLMGLSPRAIQLAYEAVRKRGEDPAATVRLRLDHHRSLDPFLTRSAEDDWQARLALAVKEHAARKAVHEGQ